MYLQFFYLTYLSNEPIICFDFEKQNSTFSVVLYVAFWVCFCVFKKKSERGCEQNESLCVWEREKERSSTRMWAYCVAIDAQREADNKNVL